MFPASTKGGGQCLAFPDVCKTPAAPSPLPMPFPNLSDSIPPQEKNMKAANIVDAKAKQGNKQAAAVQKAVIDQVYAATGIKAKSATQAVIMGQSLTIMSATSAHNGSSANTPAGVQIAPSQTKVSVSP